MSQGVAPEFSRHPSIHPSPPPSRPPKVFAPSWGLEFEQAAPLAPDSTSRALAAPRRIQSLLRCCRRTPMMMPGSLPIYTAAHPHTPEMVHRVFGGHPPPLRWFSGGCPWRRVLILVACCCLPSHTCRLLFGLEGPCKKY